MTSVCKYGSRFEKGGSIIIIWTPAFAGVVEIAGVVEVPGVGNSCPSLKMTPGGKRVQD